MSPRVALCLVVALLAAAPAPMPLRAVDDEHDVAVIAEKLRKLEEEVSALRRRLAELGKRPAFRPRPVVPLLVTPSGPESPAPGWIPREFNGQRYYAVPLDP